MPGDDEITWKNARNWGGIAYLVSRLLILAGAAIVPAAKTASLVEVGLDERPTSGLAARTVQGIVDTLTAWDGRWYFELVRDWYPRSVPPGITYEQPEARAAFFPVYPALVRIADPLLPGSAVTAGIAVNFVLGAAFVLLLGVLARTWAGAATAKRTMILASLYPGSFVLSITYSEAALLVAAVLCFLAIERRWWVAAGVAALVAGAARPNGLALAAACLVAALLAIRDRRDWKALTAPLLAPIGFVFTQWYIGQQAGEDLVWFRVQQEAWREGTSFGGTALGHIRRFVFNPFSSPTNVVTTMSIISVLIGIAALWRARPTVPLPAVAYTAAVVFLMVLPETVTARPRFVYTAFPLIIAVAHAWPRRWRHDTWAMMMALSGGTLVSLVVLYGLFAVVIP